MTVVGYTNPALVLDVRSDDRDRPSSLTGYYGPKVPTRHWVRYLGRWRRVYVMQFANSGSAYIVVNGDDVFLDSDTEHRLESVS